MAHWLSTRYPNLLVADLPVQFVDGEAEADDRHTPRLAQLGALGVVPAGAPAPATVPPPAEADEESDEETADGDAPVPSPPAGNASKADWAAYAEALGIDVDGMSRDEIRDLIASIDDDEEADTEDEDEDEDDGDVSDAEPDDE